MQYNITILSLIPWSFLFQRPQQLALCLANMGHRVTYIDPPVSPLSFKPKLRVNSASPQYQLLNVTQNLVVARNLGRIPSNPILGPLRHLALCINDFVLGKALRAILPAHSNRTTPSVLIVQDLLSWPACSQLIDQSLVVVLDSLDDPSILEGRAPLDVLLQRREVLSESADLVTISARRMADQFTGRHVVYLPNACDAGLASRVRLAAEPSEDPFRGKHPVVGFLGFVGSWVDIDLVALAASHMRDVTFSIVGPVNVPYGDVPGNMVFTGPVSYQDVPRYLASFDVCLCPFKLDSALADNANPVKIYEYLSAGKPVVTTAIPEVRDIGDLCYIAGDGQEFTDLIKKALDEPPDGSVRERRVVFAQENTWEARCQRLMTEIEPILHRKLGGTLGGIIIND